MGLGPQGLQSVGRVGAVGVPATRAFTRSGVESAVNKPINIAYQHSTREEQLKSMQSDTV
jgi:hypothetical protein